MPPTAILPELTPSFLAEIEKRRIDDPEIVLSSPFSSIQDSEWTILLTAIAALYENSEEQGMDALTVLARIAMFLDAYSQGRI